MNLDELRGKIDLLDDNILKLFLERMDVSEDIARYKNENSLPLASREREREILKKVTAAAGEREVYAYRLFSELFELSKARQAELINTSSKIGAAVSAAMTDELFPQSGFVACQGVEGSNSQAACDKLLPRGNIVYVKSFEAVFDAVETGLCSYGVLPIENSTAGSVRAVYELLQKKKFSIVRSTKLCVLHELLGKKGAKLSDIKEIYSHEQAIAQCSKFLSALDGVRIFPCANTAIAAKSVSESDSLNKAAISSHVCAKLYGLESIEPNICDSENNYTRFICIAKENKIYADANRISITVACDNRPGALYEILSKAASIGVNMSKLESCPVTGRNFEFVFFIDLDASVRDKKVLSMLEEMERTCDNFMMLGNYAEV
ncbi:MAG: prephenate dehydratase domain-containing protein [Clostridia bacterium]|nr:prephenate dehydratase domain-containing protein [Clostridia bacterium]